jgi:hypothetical protein
MANRRYDIHLMGGNLFASEHDRLKSPTFEVFLVW